MKLVVERDHLQNALLKVGKCVGKGTNHPIIGNVLLTAEGDGLTLSGTDLDMVASARIRAKLQTGGAATVPAKMFSDIVARTPSGAAMSFEYDEAAAPPVMTIRSGRSRIALQTLPAKDFPDLPIADGVTHRFSMSAKTFAQLLDRVDFAISRDETLFYLQGVFLQHLADEGEPARLCAVATDRHRFALHEIAAPAGSEGMPESIIPTKTASELIRIGKEMDGDVELGLGKGGLTATFADGTTLKSKLIDATYPPYRNVLPKDNTKIVALDRDAFVEASARLAAVAQDSSIQLSFAADRLQLAVKNPNGGEGVDEMEADWPHGDFSIRFSASYLRDTMAALTGDHFVAAFGVPGGPATFAPKTDPSLTLLLMPRSM